MSYGENVLERKVLRVEIKKLLTNAILNGEMNPGDRIVETRIAKELNVSQAPVREAIRELEQMGLVETKPYKGAFVRKIEREEFYEAYKLRSFLETYAIKKLINNLTEELCEEFDDLIVKMKEYAAENKRTEYIETDVAFHQLIMKSMNSNLFYTVWAMVRMAHLPYLTIAKSSIGLHDLTQDHEAIVEAIKDRDVEIAQKAVRNHIESLGEYYLKKFK